MSDQHAAESEEVQAMAEQRAWDLVHRSDAAEDRGERMAPGGSEGCVASREEYTSTYNALRFADPYHVCNVCGGWITGMLDNPGRPILTPCEHNRGFEDVCPSWGPVDSCTCLRTFGHVPHGEPS